MTKGEKQILMRAIEIEKEKKRWEGEHSLRKN